VSPAARRSLDYEVRRRLLAWWDQGHRDLPFRFKEGEADPYRVWIAEVMLQQTQVSRVLPFYERFVRRLPSLEALSRSSEEEVLGLFGGLGYYARARRLPGAAREALARHGGLPATAAALRELPGFGPYTAGAVASIAFGEEVACVDGNVARVLSRLFLVRSAPELARTRERLWALAARLVPAERPGDFNQALMELGATRCTKARPRCEGCPLEGLCRARRAGLEVHLPRARRRPTAVAESWACAVIRRGGRLLFARRPRTGLFGGLWALPSAAVPQGEDPRRVLRHVLTRTLGAPCAVGEELGRVERLLSHRRLELSAYACRAERVPVGADLVFSSRARQAALAVPAAVRSLLGELEGDRVGRARRVRRMGVRPGTPATRPPRRKRS
jgi:A/G-specific adenine glycosylase